MTDPRVIIAGFGRVGQIVGRLLASLRIPFAALDRDPAQVDLVRRFGNPAYFGDPRRLDILRAAHVDQAELFVIAVGDPESSVEIAESVKRHFPNLKVLDIRGNFLADKTKQTLRKDLAHLKSLKLF